ncbi:hypothetical protein DOM21_08935 [Bacteriovorax stolpii]|uniref:hypothetical protein n=1 Tax=Bacteriovorax stolpii TaxID=960 RepID=UPI00115C1CFD|nr:hypothetical protein [Bacteriovorax stolpii]QDK41575.1 hypothetical protein DOM21_08935 [Bacteriovorax stolpii]
MLKKRLFLTFIISFGAFASEAPYPDFEAELRALETNQLKAEELQMRNVDAVTGVLSEGDLISDDVSTGQAGIQKETLKPVLEAKRAPETTLKPRRIRAR